ncbi:thyrostimulin alpha-2 subunit-like [Physella acuta]|uniref:thyrostimulin alpha-2 subunit-like n=1 Tax=Physella acuta TaxID=109671 RepID=UPI0027DC7120|nr:thyrostimulin alpha-2 subunit-like [Physella acuta]
MNFRSTISCLPRPGAGCYVTVLVLALVTLLASGEGQRHAWEAPGCHRVGFTRTVNIPGCVPFDVTTNACRGYCVSYSVPSPIDTLAFNPNFIITSKAECCGMVDTYDVKVWVACRDGFQQKTFKSARSCACSICRREQ